MANNKKFTINHTRCETYVPIVETQIDRYNSMTILAYIHYTLPTGFYRSRESQIFAIYLDRKLYRYFRGKVAKIQLESISIPSLVEIYAVFDNFPFNRSPLIPGNKLRIRFKGLRATYFDVIEHEIFWDNATGTYEDKKIGTVDAVDASAGGRLLHSGRFLTKTEIVPQLPFDPYITTENDDQFITEDGEQIIVEYD